MITFLMTVLEEVRKKRLETSTPLKLIKTKGAIPSSISLLVLIPNDFPSVSQK